MKIIKNSVVSLKYEVRSEAGEIIDRPREPLSYLHGGYHGIFPKIEDALAGRDVGEKVTVVLAPADAFGERDPALVRAEPRERLPGKVKVGMQFEGEMRHGEEVHPVVFRVTEVGEREVVLDANHPFAGRTIEFRATVLDVRPASPEEVTHGHAHGPGGHHH